jgi:hypothetical protein
LAIIPDNTQRIFHQNNHASLECKKLDRKHFNAEMLVFFEQLSGRVHYVNHQLQDKTMSIALLKTGAATMNVHEYA